MGSQLLFHWSGLSVVEQRGLSREPTWAHRAVLCHQGRRSPAEQQPLPEPHAERPPVPSQTEGPAPACARWRPRQVTAPPFPAESHLYCNFQHQCVFIHKLRNPRLSWLTCINVEMCVWVCFIAGLGLHGNLELKMENREEMSQTSQGHSSDSQRSDEEGEQKTQGESSQGDR